MGLIAVLLFAIVPVASAAGAWGYFAVVTASGQAGIIIAGPGQRPSDVNGSAVQSWVYLGPASTPTPTMVRYLQSFASQKAAGFFEYPGGLGGLINSAKSQANSGRLGAVAWMKGTPGNAAWDTAPTAIAIGVVTFAAAPTAIGAIEAGGSGAGLSGAAGALAGKAKGLAGKAQGLLSGGANSNAPADGTPAAALSTAAMAALAITALEFDHKYLTGLTKADLVSGAFPRLYATVTNYAWDFAAVMIVLLGISAVLTPWTSGAVGALGAGLGRIAMAALLIAGVPVVTMLTIGLVDALCSGLWQSVPNVSLLLHGLMTVIGGLAAASTVAHLTHHATIAHITGTGAWIVSGAGLVAAGLIALEMLARDVGIILAALVVPWALAFQIVPMFAGWGARILKALFAIIFAKPILMLALVAGASMLSAGLSSISVITIVVGLVILSVGAACPFLLYSAFGHVGHSWHRQGVSGGVMTSMPMASQIRAAHERVRRYPEPEPSI